MLYKVIARRTARADARRAARIAPELKTLIASQTLEIERLLTTCDALVQRAARA